MCLFHACHDASGVTIGILVIVLGRRSVQVMGAAGVLGNPLLMLPTLFCRFLAFFAQGSNGSHLVMGLTHSGAAGLEAVPSLTGVFAARPTASSPADASPPSEDAPDLAPCSAVRPPSSAQHRAVSDPVALPQRSGTHPWVRVVRARPSSVPADWTSFRLRAADWSARIVSYEELGGLV